MSQHVYTVRACRWGEQETHSYVVGVYENQESALEAAEEEEQFRGGKYECEVLKWMLGVGSAGNMDIQPEKIKAPPPITAEMIKAKYQNIT